MENTLDTKFVELQHEVVAQGLMKRRYGFYAIYGLLVLLGTALSLYILTISDSYLVQGLNAVFFAFVSIQAGMLGHDFSHGQVFASQKKNRFFALLIWGLYAGLSETAWYNQHNEHHKEVNKDGHDPDINIPFLFSPVQHAGNYSLPSWTQRYQHILFFLSLPVWYTSKVIITWTEDPARNVSKRGLVEMFLAIVHFAFLGYMIFAFLPLFVGILFCVVYMCATGFYMGSAFAPNHKGEEIVPADSTVTWLNQITSTRNLFPSHLTFYVFGGLNFQVEHHLFPGMPRINYWHAQKLVKRFCAENNIRYHETTWIGSMVEIYQALKRESVQQVRP